MKLRLKFHRSPHSEPIEKHRLEDSLAGLTRARRITCQSLGEIMKVAESEPSDDTRRDVDAHYKLLALIMKITGNIDSVLRKD